MLLYIILSISLLFIGFFSGLEVAFVSANKLSIELKKKQGKKSGIILSHFAENPSRFVGICLTGFQLSLVLYALSAYTSLKPLWRWSNLESYDRTGFIRLFIELFLLGLVVLFIRVLFRGIFRARSERLLGAFASVAAFFDRIFKAINQTLVSISVWIIRYIFNVKLEDPKRPFSRIDLEHYFQQTKESEAENADVNKELFENALSLPGVKVRSCLVPRREIVGIDLKTPMEEVVARMIETKLSRLIVYDGSVDNIVGYVHQLDMFKNPQSIQDVLLPITAVPETMTVSDLLDKLTQEGRSIAWVVDEFGGTAGIVTMEDLLEEIFGEIRDEYDTEEFVDKQLATDEYIFSGRLELDFLQEKYGLVFDGAPTETISGYIISHHDEMPRQGSTIFIGKYQFDILNISATRIDLVKVKLL